MDKKDSDKNIAHQNHNLILNEKIEFLTTNSYKILKSITTKKIETAEEIKKREMFECLLLSFLLFDSTDVKFTLVSELDKVNINENEENLNCYDYYLRIIYKIAELIIAMPIEEEKSKKKKAAYRDQLREYLKNSNMGKTNIDISNFIHVENEQIEDAKLIIKRRS